MGAVVADITMSVDGYVAGPHAALGRGLGEGGERLHNWVMGGPWTYESGPRFTATGVDREVLDAAFVDLGAVVVGRTMYDVVDGWGDEAAFPAPVFVLTHRPQDPRAVVGGSYTFVTGGVAAALEQAQTVAGSGKVHVAGGARTVQQFLAAGLVDQLDLHIAPLLLGRGVRLFEGLGSPLPRLEPVAVRKSPHATHLRYLVR